MTLRVLVADDQAVIRIGLRGIIDATPGFQVVAEAADGDQAVELAARTRPDVALMDIRMPSTDGIEATRRITSDPATTGTRVLVLTTFDLDEYVYGALRAGASGFLLKDTPPAELLHAINVIATGEALLAPSVTRRLIQQFLDQPAVHKAPTAQPPRSLTERETQVLALVAHGLTNTEISRQLHITVATAKGHVRHLLTKLDARDRVHLVILAYEHGLT